MISQYFEKFQSIFTYAGLKQISNYITDYWQISLGIVGILILLFIIHVIHDKMIHTYSEIHQIIQCMPMKFILYNRRTNCYYVSKELQQFLQINIPTDIWDRLINYNPEIKSNYEKILQNEIEKFDIYLKELDVTLQMIKYENHITIYLNNNFTLENFVEKIQNPIYVYNNKSNILLYYNDAFDKICEHTNYSGFLKISNENKDSFVFKNHLYKRNMCMINDKSLQILTNIDEFKNFFHLQEMLDLQGEIFNLINRGILIINKKGIVLFMNDTLQNICLLKSKKNNFEEFCIEFTKNLLLSEDIKKFTNNYMSNIINGTGNDTYSFQNINGVFIHQNVFHINNKYIVLSFEDNTNNLNQQQQLKKQIKQYNFFISYMDAILLTFSNNKLIWKNPNTDCIPHEYLINSSTFYNTLIKQNNGKYKFNFLNTEAEFDVTREIINDDECYVIKKVENKINVDKNNVYFKKIFYEIEVQKKYLEYLKNKLINREEEFERLCIIERSVIKNHLNLLLYMDNYSEDTNITLSNSDVILFMRNFFENINSLYNSQHFNISFKTFSYILNTNLEIFTRILYYLTEFIYSFVNSQRQIIIGIKDNKFMISVTIDDKFDINNNYNNRIIFVINKLLNSINMRMIIEEEEKKFVMKITE